MGTLLSAEVQDYLKRFLTPYNDVCKELEQAAEKEMIPIMDADTAQLIRILGLSYQPENILEIGTAIGYSAYVMANSTSAHITTIEIDESRYQRAIQLFEQERLSNRITALLGDAFEWIPKLEQKQYDWIFLDAAKGQYPRFLELLVPFMKPRSLLFSDNILFQGLVSGPETVKHKLRTLVVRLREYNELLAHHPKLETTFLPVGDGLAISTLRGL